MIQYFIISDGSSDRLLIHPIDWVFRTKGVESKGERIDFVRSGSAPKSIAEKVDLALTLNPDIKFLFIIQGCRKASNRFSQSGNRK